MPLGNSFPDLQHTSFRELQDGLSTGLFTSVDLVNAYLARIEEVNPVLKAVICTSPVALKQAARLDEERKQGKIRGILHGIPIGIKDNIATRIEDGMDTTAGSYALEGAIVPGDAEVVRKLREAGAILLCKLNLSVWANFRGVDPGAWSPVGGQCTNPYVLSGCQAPVMPQAHIRFLPKYPNGQPSGSSSGSGVAVAAGLCAAALGTETNGSIVAPAGWNAVCGVRPGLGVISQAGVVPISSTKDTVGPMTQTIEDAALLMNVLASTAADDKEYSTSLTTEAFQGKTVLVPENMWAPKTPEDPAFPALHPHILQQFAEAISILRKLGATVKIVKADLDAWQPLTLTSAVPLGFLPEDTTIGPYHSNSGERVVLPVDVLSTFPNEPFGLTLAARGNSEAELLGYAYAFEQATHIRKNGKTYEAATPKTQLADVVKARQQAEPGIQQ